MARRHTSSSLLCLGLLALCAAEAEQVLQNAPGDAASSGSSQEQQPPLFLQRSRRGAPQVQSKESYSSSDNYAPNDPNLCTKPPPQPTPSKPEFSCTASCPLCPTCPAAPHCPSPCPALPKCPELQQCPSPCAKCPSCSACPARIPPGYEHFPGLGYYRLHLTPITWLEAKATCEREGAYLAIINSQEEADLMKNLFGRDRNMGHWLYLGFHDLHHEGAYVTVLGQPLAETGYFKWDHGQPDNYNNNENCGSMSPTAGLNDLDCSAKRPFVCEFPA